MTCDNVTITKIFLWRVSRPQRRLQQFKLVKCIIGERIQFPPTSRKISSESQPNTNSYSHFPLLRKQLCFENDRLTAEQKITTETNHQAAMFWF